LEIEFQITNGLKIAPIFEDKDWSQFMWMYERMNKQIEDENRQQNGMQSMQNMIQSGRIGME
jgi:hypothetical protein